MKYRLDLHTHTEGSPDSRNTLEEMTAAAAKKGIHALAVTDHNRCSRIFEDTRINGVLLIPGVEYSTECGHLLGLFLKKPCHAEGEETGRVKFSQAAAAIHEAGGLCVLAHPYELTQHTEEEISTSIRKNAPLLDGIEIFNCRASKKRKNANELAKKAAEKLEQPVLQTAGSDAHTPKEIGGAFVTVEAEELTAAALRTALEKPIDYSCGRCPHMAIAESQRVKLCRKKAGLSAWLRWTAFAGICLLRQLKGAFSS